MNPLKSTLLVLCMSLLLFNSCKTSRPATIERTLPDPVSELSGYWNDTDSKKTAEAIVSQLLGARSIQNFERTQNRKPSVMVGLIDNKSHREISAEIFIRDLERVLANQESVRLVLAGEQREETRREQETQQKSTTAETLKKWGHELGADFMLQGNINTSVEQSGSKRITTYDIHLELSNLETNEIVWNSDKKLRAGQ